MPVKNFIFLSSEGYTFQPESKSVVPDVENLQVIGFSSGSNSEEAFNKLVMESTSLVESSFKELFGQNHKEAVWGEKTAKPKGDVVTTIPSSGKYFESIQCCPFLIRQ